MKIHTLGTSAGTQPFAGFHHTCIAIETEKSLYFLDAGECGAYTAHINGIDLLKTKAIFITHPHMDHVGGLGNLLWYIRKMTKVKKTSLIDCDNIDIYTPCLETAEGFMTVLKNTEGDFECDHTHTIHKIKEGKIFDNGEISITAIHTNHLQKKGGEYMSYAFKIECEGKLIVFTGDMKSEDLEDLLPDSCDAFLVETGHHLPEDICRMIREKNCNIGKLLFVHNRGSIMTDVTSAEKLVKNEYDGEVYITRDGMTFEI